MTRRSYTAERDATGKRVVHFTDIQHGSRWRWVQTAPGVYRFDTPVLGTRGRDWERWEIRRDGRWWHVSLDGQRCASARTFERALSEAAAGREAMRPIREALP